MPVVDASIVIEWISPEADNFSPALRLFKRLAADGNELLAPRLLEEVSNALVSGNRAELLTRLPAGPIVDVTAMPWEAPSL